MGGLALASASGFQQAASVIGWISLAIVGLAVVALVVFGIIRLATPERNMRGTMGNAFEPPPQVPDRNVDEVESEPALMSEPVVSTPELVQQLPALDEFQFEKLIGLAFRNLGYEVTQHGNADPDGAIDLIIQKDGQRTAVQCRQWKAGRVGIKPVREFLGALAEANIRQGKFITLYGHTTQAGQFARNHDIELVTETELAWMFEATAAGADPEVLNLFHDSRKFCPKCERELAIQVDEMEPGRGSKYWRCSGYPDCDFAMPLAETNPAPAETAPRAELPSFA
jgi:hypothetical protein